MSCSRETCFSALSWSNAPTKSRLIVLLLLSESLSPPKKDVGVTHVRGGRLLLAAVYNEVAGASTEGRTSVRCGDVDGTCYRPRRARGLAPAARPAGAAGVAYVAHLQRRENPPAGRRRPPRDPSEWPGRRAPGGALRARLLAHRRAVSPAPRDTDPVRVGRGGGVG